MSDLQRRLRALEQTAAREDPDAARLELVVVDVGEQAPPAQAGVRRIILEVVDAKAGELQ